MQEELFSKKSLIRGPGEYIFNSSKSIDELYTEVKEHDIVLTIDAPLATALNKRAKKELAITPRQLTLKIAESSSIKIYSKFELISLISKQEKRSVKVIHPFIESILDVMDHSSSFEEVMEFASQEERRYAKYFDQYPVIEKLMMDFDPEYFGNKKIAVINQDSFSLLESLFIPPGFDHSPIDIFKEEEFKFDKTYIFNSSKEVVDKALDLLLKTEPKDCAIVISPDSEESVLLKARLNESGIQTVGSSMLSDEPSVRSLFEIAERALNYNDLLAGDLTALASIVNIEIGLHNSQKSIKEVLRIEKNNFKLKEFTSQLQNIEKLTFSRFAEKISSEFNIILPAEYYKYLEETGFSNLKISEQSLIDLRYILDNFDIELLSVKEGILFADPCSSVFIDRKKIIFLNMDNTWMKLTPDKIYYDKNKEDLNSFNNFKALLQQGSSSLYFVKAQSMSEKIVPCYYFNYVSQVNDFNDKFFSPVIVKPAEIKKGQKFRLGIPTPSDVTPQAIESLSPSSFNMFYLCPKKYEFSRLIQKEDSPAMLKGNLVHDYAEMYFQQPEFCKANRIKILDKITQSYIGEFDSINEKYARSEFTEAMRSIEEFIDRENFEKIEFEKDDEIKVYNSLMNDFKLSKKYKNTESLIPASANKIHGKIDLYSRKTIVDYKTGPSKNIIENNIETFVLYKENEALDFQAISYIKILYDTFCNDMERIDKDLKIEMMFYHMLCNITQEFENIGLGIRKSTSKKDDRINKVTFLNMSFREFMTTSEFTSAWEVKNKPLTSFFRNIPEMFKELDLSTESFASKDIFTGKNLKNITKYFVPPITEKVNPDNFLKFLFDIRHGKTFFYDNCKNYFFKEDLEEFTELLKNILTELNENIKTVFPAIPVFDDVDICRNCDFLSVCSKNLLFN